MAHPYNSQRDHKVQHSRVGAMTKGYAAGGGIHSDAKADSKMIKRMVKSTALKLHGGSVGSRTDKPKRAAGGNVPSKKNKGTTVNVIISGVGEKDKPPMMMPPKPPMMPPPGPPPGAMAPPGGPPPGGAPVPGMPPMRAKGGKVSWEGSKKDVAEDKRMANARGMTMKAWEKSAADKAHDRKRASGGAVSDASQGKTSVQSQNMKETALKNVGRGPVVTK